MDKERILDSWKEISAYLGRNVRTCQNWEHELGLPVHRLDGSPKARVFAYAAELDLWRDEKGLRLNGIRKRVKPARAWRLYAALGVTAVAIALAMALDIAGSRKWLFGPARPQPITSLAVLPIKDLSGDRAVEYFADGMTDALINRLSDIAALRNVTAHTSVIAYKNSEKSSALIAKELGVDAIVEASVVRSGSRIKIQARLIRARGEQPLGPPISFEREMAEVLALESELVREIANEIRIQLTPQESERLKASRPVDPEAYELALDGKVTLERATRELEFRRAIELFEKAVDRDPAYAPAWAGLGEALWYIGSSGFEYVDPEAVRGRAIAAADKALELDPGLPEAHQARGSIAYDGEWDIEKAARHFERALELRPSFASAHAYYSLVLMTWLGRFEEAGRHIDRAQQIDPLMPWNNVGYIAWWQWQGRPDKALAEGDRARRRNPTYGAIRWRMGSLLLLLGQPERAISEFEAADELSGPGRLVPNFAAMGLANGLAGRRTEALRILAEMERLSRERYVSPFSLAIVNSGLGRMDEAFRLLERALDERHPALVFCRPYRGEIVALRRDPRWQPLIDRLRKLVKLPPGTPDPYS